MKASMLVCAVLVVAACRPDGPATTPQTTPSARAEFDPDAAVADRLAAEEVGPPPDGWWKTARPCPQGTKLVELQPPPEANEFAVSHEMPSYQCQRPDGTIHGGSTMLIDGVVASTTFYRNGGRHGHGGQPESSARPGESSTTLFDDGVGIGTWRERRGDNVIIKEHRGPREIYFTERTASGERRQEGLVVDGVRTGAWIFGTGADERRVVYTEGKPAGADSVTGVAECEAGVQRWRKCLDTKQGADRYDMAEWLASYVWMWELVPVLHGHDEPQCVTMMPLVGKQLEAYGCAPR
jgi:hypothetical protein